MFLIPISVQADDNDTFLITSPMLPEVTTFAETADDIERRARDAVEEAIAGRIAGWKDIVPQEGDQYVRLPLLSGLKLALFLLCKTQGVTRADLMRRMNVQRETVDRLFRLDHASKLDQIEDAFRAIGKEVDLSVEDRRAPEYA
jgi:antitoxin HicB